MPRPTALAAFVAVLLAAAVQGCGAQRPASGHPSPSSSARTLVWSDEFTGPSDARLDAARWVTETGGHGWGNHELEYYTDRSRNASLDGDGNLVIQALRERFEGGG